MTESDFWRKNVTTILVATTISTMSAAYFTLFQREQAEDLTVRINEQFEVRLTELEFRISRQNIEIARIADRIDSLDHVVKSREELEFQLGDVVERLEQIQGTIGERQ